MISTSSRPSGKRIALVAPFGLCQKGTARARVMPLGRALASRGYHVRLFVPPYDCPEDCGASYSEGNLEFAHADVPALVLRERSITALWMALGLLRLIGNWRPDVVHVFKPKGPSGLAGSLLWVWPRIFGGNHRSRMVVDTDDWEGDGGWNDDPRTGYSALQKWIFRRQERYGLSHADAWTVATRCLAERTAMMGAARDRVWVMPNGVTVDSPAPSATVSATAHRVVLYTRFAGVDPHTVREIWTRVRGGVDDAQLLVVGRGLVGEERVLDSAPGVILAGWTEDGQLASSVAGAQVAIVPWEDTPRNRARSSAKVRELMALGLAVVAFGVGELPELVGDAGIVVRSGEPALFAESVVELLLDPQRAARLGNAARNRMVAEYDWTRLSEIALRSYGML